MSKQKIIFVSICLVIIFGLAFVLLANNTITTTKSEVVSSKQSIYHTNDLPHNDNALILFNFEPNNFDDRIIANQFIKGASNNDR